LALFEQDYVGPAQLCLVIGDGTTHHAAADDDDLGMGGNGRGNVRKYVVVAA
jgi:hypothetical protein